MLVNDDLNELMNPGKANWCNCAVPQQDNSYDCGLFVLYFIERFIKDAPPRIRREDLNMFGRKWFRPAEASRLRSYIKGLLKKHFEEMRNAR
ncbi:hypothetical protein SUGI_0134600 [Cryptomeria japonica]|nr:hypothetical protein SUGI_0134600 [Cryptomeria japonica]